MPVKVEQINEYLFSDTVQSQKITKKGSDEISQGQYRGYPIAGLQVQRRSSRVGWVRVPWLDAWRLRHRKNVGLDAVSSAADNLTDYAAS